MNDLITQSTALVVLPVAELPTILAADDKDILGALFKELGGWEPDISTPKGRAEIASKAQKVRVAKADFGRLADRLKEDAIKTQKSVNAEYKVIEARLNELIDRVRAPLNEYEAAEAARIAANNGAIAALEALAEGLDALSPAEVEARLASIRPFEWSIEFKVKGERVRAGVVAQLQVAHQAAVKREAEAAAEAERLAREAEERRLAEIEAQRVREEQIAAEAAEAARVEAEAKAAREAAEAEERAQAALREAREATERAEREAAEAIERERIAEENRIATHKAELIRLAALATDWPSEPTLREMEIRLSKANDLAARDWQEFAAHAAVVLAEAVESLGRQIADERENIRAAEEIAEQRRQQAAAEKAEADRLVAERQRQEAADRATEAERQRVAREAAAQKAEDEKRAANRAHRAGINREIVADLMVMGGTMTADLAHEVVVAIAKGQIRHVAIQY